MKIACPKCRAEVPANNINAEKDYVFCSACGEAFRLSDLFAGGAKREERIPSDNEKLDKELLRNPPTGTWIHEDGFNIYIGARFRSPIALFLIPFTFIWSGGSLFGIYGSQILSGEFSLILSLFGLPFLIGSIFLISFTLMATVGKIEICLGRAGYVFKGVGSLGLRKFFDWNAITRIYDSRGSSGPQYGNRRQVPAIILEGNTQIKIASQLLNEEKRRFLFVALTSVYRETHKKTF